jgi:hypothetical protein
MPADNKLELVVEVDVNKANASIKTINTGLFSMEQAASNAARGAAAGMDQMTASMVKGATAGNLIAESIKKALDWAKEWTIGAAQFAAHTDRMGLSMQALAKAHGVSAAAAAIENITPGEALEKLLVAIESGASRGLRTMGIFVDLNKEVQRQELLTGKTLDENEIRQLRYSAVMREAAKIQGAAAAASGSAEAQSAALAREVNELKEAIGEQFQGYLRSWVGHLRDLVGFLKENSDWLVKFAHGAVVAAGILATYGLATKILEIGAAVNGLTVALTANPWALLLTGVVAAGAIVWNKWQTTKEGLDRGYEDVRRKGLQRDLLSGKLKPGDVTKMGYTEDQLREIVSGKRPLPGESWGEYTGPKLDISLKGEPGARPEAHELTDEEVRRIAEVQKKQGEAEKQAAEYYLRAVAERKSAEHDQARARIEDSLKIIESTHSETAAVKESVNVLLFSMQERQAGMAKIRDEEQREIAARSTYVDEKSGAVRYFELSASTLETIHKGTAEKLAAFDLKFNEEESRRIEAIWKAMAARLSDLRNQLIFEPMQQGLFISGQSFELDTKREDARLGYEKAAVQQRRDIALAQLEAVDADTLRDKLALEQRKTGIEVDAIRRRTAIERQEIDRRTEADISAAERAMLAKGIFDDARQNEVRSRILQLGEDEKDALKKGTASQIDVERTRSATRARQLIEGQYTAIFQTLKEQAGGVFDALFTKSQSVWAAIGNSFKKTMLDVLRDVVTSRIAAMFTELLTGGEAKAPKGGGKTLPGQLKELGGALAWLGVFGPAKQQPVLADSLMTHRRARSWAWCSPASDIDGPSRN